MDHHNNTNHHQQHPFLQISNNYMAAEGAVASSDYCPVNFKLGLNEINCESSKERDAVGKYNARHTSLEMHYQHCWPQDSSSIIKQTQHFWEHLPAEVSNEKSEIIVENNIKMNQKQPLQICSNNSKPSLVYEELGELEAIYKRCGTTIINQTLLDGVLSRGQEQGSDEASIDSCLKDNRQEDNRKKMKKKKRMGRTGCNEMVQFFEKLVKQLVDLQENLHTRMERLDVERREKEEASRNREFIYFEQQAAARALATTREDAIVSYLEKITGLNIPSLPSSFYPSS